MSKTPKPEVEKNYHLESNESIEAILVIDATGSLFPSVCFPELSPTCDGFHEES